MFGDQTRPTGDRARDTRLEATLQHLRDMIRNMENQQKMGVPVDPQERQMYASLGMMLKDMMGSDAQDFHQGAHIVTDGINTIRGGGQNVGSQPNGFQQGPSSVLEAMKMSREYMEVAEKVTAKLISQGLPEEVAISQAMKVVSQLLHEGVAPDQIMDMGIQVIKMGPNGPIFGNEKLNHYGQEGGISKPMSAAELFEQTLKQNNKHNNDSDFPF